MSNSDQLTEQINNLEDVEIRMVLEHLCLVHPEEVQAALAHVQQDDMFSVATQHISNKTEYIPPPGKIRRNTSGGDLKPSGTVSPAPFLVNRPRSPPEEDTTKDSILAPLRRQPSVLKEDKPRQPTAPKPPSRHRPSIFGQHAIQGLPHRSLRESNPALPLLESHDEYDVSGELTQAPSNNAEDNNDNNNNSNDDGGGGGGPACYLVYDSNTAKLLVHYSKTPVMNALGVWRPTGAHQIKGFKFTQNFGRSELIGNCAAGVAGRKNFYSGWCQFIRLSRVMDGIVKLYPKTTQDGLDVDLFTYYRTGYTYNAYRIGEGKPFATVDLDAVACLPKNTSFYHEMNIDLTKWMTEASAQGFATEFAPSGKSNSPRMSISRNLSSPHPSGSRPEVNASSVAPKNSFNTPASNSTSACYLVYDNNQAKLMAHYSHSPVPNALGKWTPGEGKKIQGFKFTENLGRRELIGNCAAGVQGRKRYCSGWCQFIKLGKALNGNVTLLNEGGQGLPVDVYLYFREGQKTLQLQPNETYNVASIAAVACLPMSAKFYADISVDIIKWLADGSSVGSATKC